MTPEQIARKLQNAMRRAAQGDLAGALSLCERVVRYDHSNQPAFQMYRELYNAAHGRDVPHADVFDFIYASNFWSNGSGLGSSPQATEAYRKFLQDFLTRHAIRSVIDAGCGDWQFSRLIDWSGIDYLGIDVSHRVLKNSKSNAAPNIRFAEGDFRTHNAHGSDLLIMKDVLQHWSNADIQALIPKFSHYRYCLITNGVSPGTEPNLNKDILSGNWRPVDLALPPFSVSGEYVQTYDLEISIGEGRVARERKRVFLICEMGAEQSA